MSTPAVLEVESLNVRFGSAQQEVSCVSDFSLSVERGECVGVVGESGAGKSQAFLAIMGLLAPGGRAAAMAGGMAAVWTAPWTGTAAVP